MKYPKLIIFDVNQTIFSLEEMQKRFESCGITIKASHWFETVLKEGFVSSNLGKFVTFKEIANIQIKKILTLNKIKYDKEILNFLIDGFSFLKAHPDIKPAFELLNNKKINIVTLTNGPRKNAENLLKKNNIDKFVSRCFSIEEVQVWKPNVKTYNFVLKNMKTEPSQSLMIAAHGWDLEGAKSLGIKTGFINRYELWVNKYYTPPDFSSDNAIDLIKKIIN